MDQYIKKLKESPSTLLIGGGAIALGLLIWLMVTVGKVRDEKAQREHWQAVEKNRPDPLALIYDDPQIKQFAQGRLAQYLPMLLPGAAAKLPDKYAEVGMTKLGELESLAKKNEGNTAGPWLYYYLGNLYYAKAEFDKARSMYERAEKLAKQYKGHLLTGHFRVLQRDLELAAKQVGWQKKFAERARNRPTGNNPKVSLLVDQGEITLELYHAENPALVKRFCELVVAGYFDGLPFYEVSPPGPVGGGRALSGCWYGNGKGELAPEGLPARLIDRMHKKGTISMALLDDRPDRASANRFFIVLADSERGPSQFDGKNPVIGQVTKGLDLLDKLLKGEKVLRAKVLDPGDLKGKLRSGKQEGGKKK